jgi:hypothetical protein
MAQFDVVAQYEWSDTEGKGTYRITVDSRGIFSYYRGLIDDFGNVYYDRDDEFHPIYVARELIRVGNLLADTLKDREVSQ